MESPEGKRDREVKECARTCSTTRCGVIALNGSGHIYLQRAHRPKQHSLWELMLSWKRIVSPASKHTTGLGTKGKAWVSLEEVLWTRRPFGSNWSDEKSPATGNRTKQNEFCKISSMWKHLTIRNEEQFLLYAWAITAHKPKFCSESHYHKGGATGIRSQHTLAKRCASLEGQTHPPQSLSDLFPGS